MSKQQPSLQDLGLDGPATKPFGNAFDNYDSSEEEQPKTWVDSVKLDPQPEKSGVAAVLSFLIPGLGQLYRGQIFFGFCCFFVLVMLVGLSSAFPPALIVALPVHFLNVYLAYVG